MDTVSSVSQSPATTPRRVRHRDSLLDITTLPREPDAAALPKRVTRKQAAQILTRYFFPISPRTLEAVSLPYVSLPGMPALIETEALLAWAEERLASAVRLTGGRKRAAA